MGSDDVWKYDNVKAVQKAVLVVKKAIKHILIIFGSLAAAVLGIIGFFAVKGAIMWNDAKTALPLDTAVPGIRADENYVSFEELPKFYIDAVVSVEDRRFFDHKGIDPKAICRAVLYDIKTLSLAQGGSTITQQLAKNIWFSEEKRLERKFAEMFAASELEKALSKNEILELYVNLIYFGSGYYGIGEASEGYFGKSPDTLTDYECAMLAGLPNAPSVYSPDASPELAEQRLSLVIYSMQDNGVITEQRAKELLAV